MKNYPNDIKPPIYFENAQWVLTDYGLECLDAYYQIPKSGIFALRWDAGHNFYSTPLDLAEKSFVNPEQLMAAFLAAFRIYGEDCDAPLLNATLLEVRGLSDTRRGLAMRETIVTAKPAEFAANSWMLGWDDVSRRLEIGPWPDKHGWSERYPLTTGNCVEEIQKATDSPDPGRRLLAILKVIHEVVVGGGLPARVVHLEFLKIEDYRQHFGRALQ